MSDLPPGIRVLDAAPALPAGVRPLSTDLDWIAKSKAAADAVDERLAKSIEDKPVVDPGGVGAVGHGLQSGLSFGFAPKIDAATYAALTGIGSDKPFGERYQEQLSKNLSEGQKLQKEHPKLHFAADLVGGVPGFATGMNPILAGALGGGLRAAGESPNVAGEQGTNLRGGAEAAGGAATGAATAYLLPKLFGALGSRFGRKADVAATDAATMGTQTARDKFNRALEPVKALAPGGEFAPGETATTLRELGIVGGVRGQRGVLKGVQRAQEELGGQFGDLIAEANAVHPGVTLGAAQRALANASEENLGNSLMERESEKAMARLEKVANKDGFVPHSALQDVLENMNKSARKYFPKPQKSEGEDAFLAAYRALRGVQDEGLEAATGRSSADLRKYMATAYGLEPVAQKAVNRLEGNDKVGLLGELQKQKGSTSLGHGLILLGTGNPVLGGGMILKGLLNTARGQFGRSGTPLINNLATSGNLTAQTGANLLRDLSESAAGRELESRFGAAYGAPLGGMAYDALSPEPAPAEPTLQPSPEVAALPQTLKKTRKK